MPNRPPHNSSRINNLLGQMNNKGWLTPDVVYAVRDFEASTLHWDLRLASLTGEKRLKYYGPALRGIEGVNPVDQVRSFFELNQHGVDPEPRARLELIEELRIDMRDGMKLPTGEIIDSRNSRHLVPFLVEEAICVINPAIKDEIKKEDERLRDERRGVLDVRGKEVLPKNEMASR